MVLQWSKIFYYKVSSEFLWQDSQSLYSFGKIQNVRETELSEEKKNECFLGEIFHIPFSHIYIYIYITSIYTYSEIYIYIYILHIYVNK